MRTPKTLREDVPLAPLTTLGVGGSARFFADVDTEASVVEALGWAHDRALPVVIIGGGSNLLVADRGFDGLVIRPAMRGIALFPDGDRMFVEVGAGERFDDLVARAVALDLAGLECLSGIPGDVGATPVQNVGAYGQEVKETIVSLRAIDRSRLVPVDLDRTACAFRYRDSVFKREAVGRYVIVAVRFELRRGTAPEIRYAELAQRVAETGAPQSLAALRAAVIALRRRKSMVHDVDDENHRSAGSFFMNPTVSVELAALVQSRAEAAGVLAAGAVMPAYPAPAGQVKLSAAWLIERAGFGRGTADGPVGISTRHALAIVNRGGATAARIASFARRVREAVLARFGVTLSPEPSLVGFTEDEIKNLIG